jgi:hypothetical protein
MNNIISLINSPIFLFYLKIIFIIIGIILFGAVAFFLLRNSWLKKRFLEDIVEVISYRPFGVKKTFKQWTKLAKKLETGKESDYKMVLIEADSLLASILKKMGYKGDNMRELLEQMDAKILPNIENVWQAHKLRNNIVHDPDYELSLDKARTMLQIYEQAFRDLEMF